MEHSSSTSCLKCGPEFEHNDAPHVVVAAQQQQRIEELESQVRFLTEKASAAADKLADYEDAFHQGQLVWTKSRKVSPLHSAPGAAIDGQDVPDEGLAKALPPPPPHDQDAAAAIATTVANNNNNNNNNTNLLRRPTVSNRFASFLTSRRGSPAGGMALTGSSNMPTPVPPPINRSDSAPPPIAPVEQDMAFLLAKETSLRQAAEASLAKVHSEMEELSASLFEQANGMVSDERRARAATEQAKAEAEERARKMEGRLRTLEGRDSRMDMLEEAVRRVGRVRHVLGVSDAHRASVGGVIMGSVTEG